MKVAFAIVWLLSSGQFQGEPWKYFDSWQACEDWRQARLENDALIEPGVQKYVFTTACIDTSVKVPAEGFHFDVEKK